MISKFSFRTEHFEKPSSVSSGLGFIHFKPVPKYFPTKHFTFQWVQKGEKVLLRDDFIIISDGFISTSCGSRSLMSVLLVFIKQSNGSTLA